MSEPAPTITSAVSSNGQNENKTGRIYLLVHSGQGDIGGQYKALAGTSAEEGQLIPTVIYESTNKAHVEKLLAYFQGKMVIETYRKALDIVMLD